MGNTNDKTKTNIDQSNQSHHLTNTSTSSQIPSDLTDLKDACEREDVNKIIIIIKQRPDLINEELIYFGDTLLMISCRRGWYDIVKYILSNHSNTININKQHKLFRYTALYNAVYWGKVNCVRLLLSHPIIDVNIQYNWFNKTVLWYCGNRDCYDLLLPHYPTMKDHVKRMAWLYSMYDHRIGGVKEVKDMLQAFSHDELYEMRDDMGMLLWRPGKTGDEEMIEYLISSYSDVININIQDKSGWTALNHAVSCDEVDCMRLLLSHPMIDVNIQYNNGNTALHQAVLSNRVDCINILLNHPTIDFTIRNKEGKTVYEIDPSIKTKMSDVSVASSEAGEVELS